jgi:hypothetical protein
MLRESGASSKHRSLFNEKPGLLDRQLSRAMTRVVCCAPGTDLSHKRRVLVLAMPTALRPIVVGHLGKARAELLTTCLTVFEERPMGPVRLFEKRAGAASTFRTSAVTSTRIGRPFFDHEVPANLCGC